jgi:hypothetical protein
MTVQSKPEDRKMIVMKWGDNCWLRDLSSASDLNGKHVRLEKWIDAKQRWQCAPIGWTYIEEFVAVKPKNLSNEPPENGGETTAASSSSTSGPQLAALLEVLMKRGHELQGQTVRLLKLEKDSDASLEASLRLGMWQEDLLKVQLQILSMGGSQEQVKQARSKLSEVRNATALKLKQWKVAGYEPPDYWEAATLADEALLKGDVDQYRGALSARG